MKQRFKKLDSFSIPGCVVETEEEELEIPTGYDEHRRPPVYRIAIQIGKQHAKYCTTTRELFSVIQELENRAALFKGFPTEFASIISRIEFESRPIRNHKFYQSIADSIKVQLTELAPSFDSGILIWNELDAITGEVIKRRLNVQLMEFVN